MARRAAVGFVILLMSRADVPKYTIISRDVTLRWSSLTGMSGTTYSNTSVGECASICDRVEGTEGFQHGKNGRRDDCVCAQGLLNVKERNRNWDVYAFSRVGPVAFDHDFWIDKCHNVQERRRACASVCPRGAVGFIHITKTGGTALKDQNLCKDLCFGGSHDETAFSWLRASHASSDAMSKLASLASSSGWKTASVFAG